MKLEKKLPSTDVKRLPVTEEVIEDPEGILQKIISTHDDPKWTQLYEKLTHDEKESLKEHLGNNEAVLAGMCKIGLTPSRMDLIADVYTTSAWSINGIMEKIGTYYDQVKKVEAYFHKTHDLNVNLDDDAIDIVIREMFSAPTALGEFYKQLTTKFEYGFKLIRDRVGQDTFVITKEAMEDPEGFFNDLVKKIYTETSDS